MERYNKNYGKKADDLGLRVLLAPARPRGKINPTYADYEVLGYKVLIRTEAEEREGCQSVFDCWKDEVIEDGRKALVMKWKYIQSPIDEELEQAST